tara:strand:+ start:57 stop:827 length:771 start_codon:yes stop_codon:yes gene_type:complete
MQKFNNFFNFKNKIVLLTGSSGQLGKSFVDLFLAQKSKVIGIDIKKNNLKKKNFFYYRLDITNKNEVDNFFTNIQKKFKRIDVIINNAGFSTFSHFNNRKEHELDKTIDVNIKGALNIINSYSKVHLKKKLKKCSIINISSIYGVVSPDFRIYGKGDNFNSEIYGATKAALIQITKYYSVILAKSNININCISPGGILNKSKPQNKKFVKKYSLRVPKNRMGRPSDLFTALMFLSSEDSEYVNGQNIIVDGGLTLW